jgi:hypothetical protein
LQPRRVVARIRDLRDDKAKEAGIVKGAQNLTQNKLRVICLKVEIFVEENRIANDEELSNKIIDGDEEEEDDESDDESR